MTFDPETGEPYLVACFHGSWQPSPGSRLALRVPQSDPLKIYMPYQGGLSASGSVEITFPDGATLRGALSWRDPVFEISVEGKGFSIPALGALQSVVPTDPFACLPPGNSDAELDELAECLDGFRRSYRSVALGSLAQAGGDGMSLDPSASPQGAGGSILEGWAWRIRTWDPSSDGLALGEEESDQLIAEIIGAAKVASASNDLAEALELTRDFFIIRKGIEDVLHPASGPVSDFLDDAGARCVESIFRLFDELDEVGDFAEYQAQSRAIAELLDAVRDLAGEVGGEAQGLPLASGGSSQASSLVLEETETQFYRFGSGDPFAAINALITYSNDHRDYYTRYIDAKYGIDSQEGVSERAEVLNFYSREHLFGILGNLKVYLRQLEAERVVVFESTVDHSCPVLSSEVLSNHPVVEDCLLTVKQYLVEKINREILDAIGFDLATDNTGDFRYYSKLRKLAENYERFFRIYRELGMPLNGDELTPHAPVFLNEYAELSEYWITRTDPDFRSAPAISNMERVEAIALSTLEGCMAQEGEIPSEYRAAYELLRAQLVEIQEKILGDPSCESLRKVLNEWIAETVPTTSLSVIEDVDHTIRVTGRYATNLTTAAKKTLQISQAGRYFEGYVQTHVAGKPLESSELKGMLISSGPDKVKFGFLRFLGSTLSWELGR